MNTPAFRTALLTVLETILGPDAEVTIADDGIRLTVGYPEMDTNEYTIAEALALAADVATEGE